MLDIRLEKAVASDMPWAMGISCRMWSCRIDVQDLVVASRNVGCMRIATDIALP